MARTPAGWLVSVAAAAVFLSPLLWMGLASLRPEAAVFDPGFGGAGTFESLSLQNYADAWRRADAGRAMLNSLLQVAGIVAGGLLVNSMAAYAFARLAFPGRDALFALVVAMIILPVEVLAVPLLLTMRDLRWTGGYGATLAALIVPFVAKAFNIYFLRQHFLNLPKALEEAAAVDGAGPLRTYWSVALPSIRPALATVAVLDVLVHWSDFLWPLMVCTREDTRTIQISLATLFTQPPIQWGDIMACAVLATLPVLLIFRVAQRHVAAADLGAGIK